MMKNLLTSIFVFLSSLFFAQNFSVDYNPNVSREQALVHMGYYQEDMISFGYIPNKINETSPYQYDLVWSKMDEAGGETKTRVSYLFMDKSVKIQMFESIYNKGKVIITINESDELAEKKKIYNINKDIYATAFLKYVNLEN